MHSYSIIYITPCALKELQKKYFQVLVITQCYGVLLYAIVVDLKLQNPIPVEFRSGPSLVCLSRAELSGSPAASFNTCHTRHFPPISGGQVLRGN